MKAKGLRQYACPSSCFSLLCFFNSMVYSSQMTANEFIGLNYCVFKKPYQNGKMGCAFLLGLTLVGNFKVCGPWSRSLGSCREAGQDLATEEIYKRQKE